MHDDRNLVEARLERVLRERIRPAVHPLTTPLAVEIWSTAGEPVPVAEGLVAPTRPIAPGAWWGTPWGTSWFKVTGQVPEGWAGRTVEAVLDLGFTPRQPGFQCEGLVYEPDGTPVKGLHPRNNYVRLGAPAVGGEQIHWRIEAASNPDLESAGVPFRPTNMGDKSTAGDAPQYVLGELCLAVFDQTVWDLVMDLEVLGELMVELPVDGARRWEILRAVGRALDAVDLQDVNGTAQAARDELAGVLAARANSAAHRISAVGHAHIDSAWLWPLRETVRKVARTASNMVQLLDEEPDFVFAMSQAQQYAWLKEHRPEVYSKVKKAVADGRFVPAGGMWVESDTNMPSSEAMARQFVYGKRFFLDEFGIENDEAWLPDTFGFAAGLPQILKAAGSTRLLTQKISWSRTNSFPHHTFDWEGVDGTRIFTHFPPVDSYNCEMTGKQLAHAARNFKEKGLARHSLAPVGYGDGGGGTTREMVAKAARLRSLEGAPTVQWEAPADFFARAEAEYPEPPVWVGELYLELHRATLTSQAQTKKGNRRSESLLTEAELWAATAAVRAGFPYPYEDLERIWKTVLLHQFHDILPGSSIAWVHREARETYTALAEELERIIAGAQRALAGEGTRELVFNPAPHARCGIPSGGASSAAAEGEVVPPVPHNGGYVLDNGLIRVEVDARGLVVSAYDRAADREAIAPGQAGNLLQLHPDFPNQWDAWDVDAFYRNTHSDLAHVDALAVEGTSVRIVRAFGGSRVRQLLSVPKDAKRLDIDTEVDWHEREKFLKLAFPLDVKAERYASETQFGHVYRPTHQNTSWEWAKFEACNHRFVHVDEPGWGVALVNDATYGHDVTRTVRTGPDAGTTTTVRASLLRAPRYPDPETDQGVHRFKHALVPGATIGDAVREGYRANLPERRVTGDAAEVEPLVRIDNDAIVVSAVKLADDRSGDLIVRLYEANGARARTIVGVDGFAADRAVHTDLLERPLADAGHPASADGGIALALRPFQMVTVRLPRSAGSRT